MGIFCDIENFNTCVRKYISYVLFWIFCRHSAKKQIDYRTATLILLTFFSSHNHIAFVLVPISYRSKTVIGVFNDCMMSIINCSMRMRRIRFSLVCNRNIVISYCWAHVSTRSVSRWYTHIANSIYL